jgi:hypothetical protein
LDDYIVSIVLRLFFKYHSEIALTYNIKKIFCNELENYFLSKNVIDEFYILMKKRMVLIFKLKIFSRLYKNKKFWNLSTEQQIVFLNELKERFLAIYDCSKGGFPLYLKIQQIINDKNLDHHIIDSTIHDRLINIIDLFGQKFLQSIDINLYSASEYSFFKIK